jgi:hypothetical protein
MKYTNTNFKKLLKDPKVKFTIILGSGFHKQAIGNDSILSNWGKLLKEQDSNLCLTGFYPLDYEQLIIRNTSSVKNDELREKNAEKIEKETSDNITSDLKSAQEEALKLSKNRYPTAFLNPKKVSDVISLNFDITAELLCTERLNTTESNTKKLSEFMSKEKKDFSITYWEVKSEQDDAIRFWYPHGSIHDSDKLTLGMREYTKRLETIERMRTRSKKKESSQEEPTSWYHELTHNPVLILGASMEKDEWDIWFALVNRGRNFAKSENKRWEKPIFQMRDCECKRDHRHEWFEPLFTGMDYQEQWEELEKLFDKIE